MNRSKYPFVYVLLVLLLAMFACKKTAVSPEKPATSVESVTIGDKFYKIKDFGKQTWTVQNYEGPGGVSLTSDNLKPGYGKHYTQEEAKAILLPQGWRLPTNEDYFLLCKSQGIELPQSGYYDNGSKVMRLMSKEAWQAGSGNNETGFEAFPAGYVYYGLEMGQGKYARFWTADKQERLQSYFTIRNENGSPVTGIRSVGNVEWMPLRFVKDL